MSTHRSFFESIWVDSSTLDSTIRFVRKFYTDIVLDRFIGAFLLAVGSVAGSVVGSFFSAEKKQDPGTTVGSGFNVCPPPLVIDHRAEGAKIFGRI